MSRCHFLMYWPTLLPVHLLSFLLFCAGWTTDSRCSHNPCKVREGNYIFGIIFFFSVCLSLSLSVCACVCICFWVCMHACTCVSVFECVCVCVCVHMFLSVCVHACTCVSVRLYYIKLSWYRVPCASASYRLQSLWLTGRLWAPHIVSSVAVTDSRWGVPYL